MNSQITNLVFSLGAMQLARKIPMEDPQILFYLRVTYVTVQVLIIGLYFYTQYVIKKKNDTTVIKYVQPPSPMAGADAKGELITTTARDYDLGKVSELSRGVYIGAAMMVFLHLYMKYTQPLFIQSIMTLKGIFDAKPVMIHILGRPATGDLKRPWQAAPSMFNPGGASTATDTATIKDAEKSEKKKDK